MSEASPGVIELVADRIRSESQPGQRDDPYKLGIIFQGGAMRGVVATGANIALESLQGSSEPFDRADCTSAGAYSWAALASRTSVETSSIYYEELSKGFITKLNLFLGHKVVNLGMLIDAVSEGEKALNFDRLLTHPTEATFYASSIPDARPVEFRLGSKALEGSNEQDEAKHVIVCRNASDILTALEATALMPHFAGSPLKLPDGRLLIDGGVAAGRIPLQQSIEAGCTHILVVVTDKNIRPEELQRSRLERLAAAIICRQFPELKPKYWNGHEIHRQTIEKLRQAESGELNDPTIQVVRIADEQIPDRTATDPARLYLAAKATEQVVLSLFESYGLKRDPSITVRRPRYR